MLGRFPVPHLRKWWTPSDHQLAYTFHDFIRYVIVQFHA